MKALDITDDDRILIIAPHPDDECIGVGGVLWKYAKQCEVIVLTDGRQGQGDTAPEKEKQIRKQEFLSEMKHLNIGGFRMFDIEDGTLLSHTDCMVGICLKEYSKIFVTGILEDHPDHKAAFLCIREAAKRTVAKEMPECYLYEVHTPLQSPTHFLDISDVVEEKCRLIRIHRSQLKELPYDVLAEQCACYRATLCRMPEKKLEVYEAVDLSEKTEPVISETEMLLQKERVNGWVLKRWALRLLKGIRVADDLSMRGITTVYVYGYGELGKLLIRELSNSGIKIKAVIDRRAGQLGSDKIPVVPLEKAEPVLPVVVTVVYEYPDIEKRLKSAGFKRIYSLRSLLEGVADADW